MYKNKEILSVIASTILITTLFHKQALGLNLILFEIPLICWLFISKQFKFGNKHQVILGVALLFSSLATIFTHSTFSYITHLGALFIFIGILNYSEAKSILNLLRLSLNTIFESQNQFFKRLSRAKFKGRKLGSYIWKFRIFTFPIIIITIFIIIYRNSNPIFDRTFITISEFIGEKLNLIFKDFDFLFIITILISLILSNFFLLRSSNKRIIEIDSQSETSLKRRKKREERNFKIIALRNEYKAGLFLLFALNFILFILNAIDIKWVWFNFEWEGQYLKQFVHEGTYLLILSIIISIALVLYFFRRNLNFYRNNKTLKLLSYIWLIQNCILTISVAIRNFRYINYFSLAYKRIGVIIFLLLTIYGLYTVYIKVKQKRTAFYLFKSNAMALFLILILSSAVNWDSVIAKYNFKNSHESFLHLNYLATLSDKALPYLDKSLAELEQTNKIQKELFPIERNFMSPEEYYNIIEHRRIDFKKEWESKNILSWNLPEYIAYKKLFKLK